MLDHFCIAVDGEVAELGGNFFSLEKNVHQSMRNLEIAHGEEILGALLRKSERKNVSHFV
jgi:hypothetical protein